MRFSDKVVLVSGASSGIGLAITEQFLKEGATVVATGRDQKKLDAIPEGSHGQLLRCASDAADSQAIVELADWVADRCGALDVLVNNAGFHFLNNPEDLEESAYQMQMDVLLKAPVFYVKHFAKLLRASDNGSVVNISSASSMVNSPGYCPYALAKAALNKFTEDCVIQVPGLRHNTVTPGFIDTPILDNGYGEGANDQIKSVLAGLDPVKRMGRPEEIAHAVLFLASNEAQYVNGANLLVDGGVSRLSTAVSLLSGQAVFAE